MTEWNGVAILFTEKAHPNKLTVPDVMFTVVAPRASMHALSWLLMPWVVEGFDGVALNMEEDHFIIR